MSGSFVHAGAMNAIQFSQDVPTGTLVGFALIAFLYWFLKPRRGASPPSAGLWGPVGRRARCPPRLFHDPKPSFRRDVRPG